MLGASSLKSQCAIGNDVAAEQPLRVIDAAQNAVDARSSDREQPPHYGRALVTPDLFE